MSWSVWLASSDTYLIPDNDSLIALSSMGSFSTVASPGWLEVPIKALDPSYESWVDESIAQARIFNLQTRPLLFPDEMSTIDLIFEIFRKRYIYLCIDGDAQDESSKYPERIHPTGYCLSVTPDGSPDLSHNHDDGIKEFTVKLRKSRAVI